MKISKVLARSAILLFSALCLLVFQLAISIVGVGQHAYAVQPFTTVVPVDPEFEDPVGEQPPTPPPIPTLGPGQTFDEADPNKPTLASERGTEEFGWGRIAGSTNLLLFWSTDSEGTHYIVVDESNPALESVIADYKEAVSERGTKLSEIDDLDLDVRKTTKEGRRNEVFALGFVIGGAVCTLITGGWCAPLWLGAVAAYGASWTEFFEQERQLSERDILVEDVDKLESNIKGTFNILASPGG